MICEIGYAGCVGRAANDLTLLFRKSAQELSSAFTVWALRLTERCVNILVADVMLPYALPMGLAAVMECVLQVMVYCSCLEDTHRVCLQPHLLRVLWPQIENAIDSHVTRCSSCLFLTFSALYFQCVAVLQQHFALESHTVRLHCSNGCGEVSVVVATSQVMMCAVRANE